jgi:hypothetical protein
MNNDQDKIIRDFLAKAGRKGGNSRAAKYGKATLRKWGKKGGRPPKSQENPKK